MSTSPKQQSFTISAVSASSSAKSQRTTADSTLIGTLISRGNEYQHHSNKKRGFTLVEMVLAIVIGATVAIIVTAGAATGLKHIRSLKRWERVQANASFLADAFLFRIKQAQLLNSPTPDELVILYPDFSTSSIKKTGNTILLDGEPMTQGEVAATNLKFTLFQKSVRINFTIQAVNASESISATTTVSYRN